MCAVETAEPNANDQVTSLFESPGLVGKHDQEG